MEFKGTKGKWRECQSKDGDIVSDQGKREPSKNVCFLDIRKERNKYDALLISKAPEMLELLKSVSELQKDNYGNGTKTHLAMIKKVKEIDELIKEATEL